MKGRFISYYIERTPRYDASFPFEMADNETIVSATLDGDGGLDVVVWVPNES